MVAERKPRLRAVGPPAPEQRVLPSDLTAEQAVLGAMLMEQDALEVGLRRLRPHLFTRSINRTIFEAFAGLYHQQRKGRVVAVDLVTLATELRRRGVLEEVGGAAYLTCLIELCPSAANVAAYIDAVLETARLRALFALGERMMEAALEPEAEPEHILAAARGALDVVEHRGGGDMRAIFERSK